MFVHGSDHTCKGTYVLCFQEQQAKGRALPVRNWRTLQQATEERCGSDTCIKVVLIIRSSIQVVDDDIVRIDPVSC